METASNEVDALVRTLRETRDYVANAAVGIFVEGLPAVQRQALFAVLDDIRRRTADSDGGIDLSIVREDPEDSSPR